MAQQERGVDPYQHWLDIPPHERPPTHYRLLGLRPQESNPQAIAAAAEQRIAHVRRFASTSPDDCRRIVAEIEQARDTLLNPARKAQYDSGLGGNRPLFESVLKPPPPPPGGRPGSPGTPPQPSMASPPPPSIASPPPPGMASNPPSAERSIPAPAQLPGMKQAPNVPQPARPPGQERGLPAAPGVPGAIASPPPPSAPIPRPAVAGGQSIASPPPAAWGQSPSPSAPASPPIRPAPPAPSAPSAPTFSGAPSGYQQPSPLMQNPNYPQQQTPPGYPQQIPGGNAGTPGMQMPMGSAPGASFPGMMQQPGGATFPPGAYGGMPGSGAYAMPGQVAPMHPQGNSYGMPAQMPMGGQGYFPPQGAAYPMQSPPMMNPPGYGMPAAPPPVPPPAAPPPEQAEDGGRAGSWVPAGRTGRLGKSFAAGPDPAANDPNAGGSAGPSVHVTGARPRSNSQPGDELSYPVAAIVITLIIFFFVSVLVLAFVYHN